MTKIQANLGMVLTILLVVLTACGESGSQPSHEASEQVHHAYRYQFSQNDCDTGSHEFSSLEEYCKGLQDEELNKGCALSLRKELFRKRCQD